MLGIPDTSDAGCPVRNDARSKAAPGISEPELIHLASRQRPAVLQRHAVGAGQRVADNAGRDEAAAIGQRRDRAGVVSQVLISAEDTVSRIQIVVQAHAELILAGALIPYPGIVIGGCLLPVDEHVGSWIAVQHVADGRVKAIRGDRVIGKPVAYQSRIGQAGRRGIVRSVR